MTGAALSPRWSAPQLITALRAAGWGELTGREWQGVRSVLTALVDRLPHRAARGLTTAEQVAAGAGLSERWARRCLAVMEDIGLIEWKRGGVVRGEPQPSWIQVHKRRLVELIEEARPQRRAAIAARRARTAHRLAGLRAVTVKPRNANRHAELSANPTPLQGGGSPPPHPGDDPMPHIPINRYRLPVTCRHGDPRGPRACMACRISALTPEQYAEVEAAYMDNGRPAPAVTAAGIAQMKAALKGALDESA